MSNKISSTIFELLFPLQGAREAEQNRLQNEENEIIREQTKVHEENIRRQNQEKQAKQVEYNRILYRYYF